MVFIDSDLFHSQLNRKLDQRVRQFHACLAMGHYQYSSCVSDWWSFCNTGHLSGLFMCRTSTEILWVSVVLCHLHAGCKFTGTATEKKARRINNCW